MGQSISMSVLKRLRVREKLAPDQSRGGVVCLLPALRPSRALSQLELEAAGLRRCRADNRGEMRRRNLSAIGPKRTWTIALQMCAFGGKADIPLAWQNVCL